MLSYLSRLWLYATLWTIARQAPLSMEFSRQEYWSGLPCLPPGDLPDPGMEPTSLRSPALAGRVFATSATWKTPLVIRKCVLMLNQSISPGNFSYPVIWSHEEQISFLWLH